jgi:hypothetical protein
MSKLSEKSRQQIETESAGIASGRLYSLKWVNRKLT